MPDGRIRKRLEHRVVSSSDQSPPIELRAEIIRLRDALRLFVKLINSLWQLCGKGSSPAEEGGVRAVNASSMHPRRQPGASGPLFVKQSARRVTRSCRDGKTSREVHCTCASLDSASWSFVLSSSSEPRTPRSSTGTKQSTPTNSSIYQATILKLDKPNSLRRGLRSG